MRSRSEDFDKTISRSHVMAVEAALVRGGKILVDPTGLHVVDGRADVDGNAATLRSMTGTIVDKSGELIPSFAGDKLTPYGTELHVWRGVVLPSDTRELMPLGVYRISAVRAVDDGSTKLEITGHDRSRSIARNRFTVPYAVPSGAVGVTAIVDLIEDRLPGVPVLVATTSTQTLPAGAGTGYEAESNPWDAVQKMAAAIGCRVRFNGDGVAVIEDEPDPLSLPVSWTYQEGPQSTLLQVEKSLDDELGYNGAVVDGEGTGAATPVHAEAWDTDPASPTYHLGPYGKVPVFLRSNLITTQAQADTAAAALLRRKAGATEQITFTSLPHPAHDAGDLVRVTRSTVKVDELYVLDAFSIPFTPEGTSTVQTRRQRGSAAE